MNKFRKWIQKHGKTILIIILVIMLFMSYGEYNSLKENFIEYQHEIEVYYAGMQFRKRSPDM